MLVKNCKSFVKKVILRLGKALDVSSKGVEYANASHGV
jgi:hypothetical protein